MNSFYGGGCRDHGFDSASVGQRTEGNSVSTRLTGTHPALMQVKALPASTFHGSQSGATSPGPSNPTGCQLYERYARDACADGAPDLITHDYAALAGGF